MTKSVVFEWMVNPTAEQSEVSWLLLCCDQNSLLYLFFGLADCLGVRVLPFVVAQVLES